MTAPDRPQPPPEWQWKAAGAGENQRAGLLYEPGNWGDVIKGIWALTVARSCATAASDVFHYLDPFAGAPTYPLAPGARARFGAQSDDRFAIAQAQYAARSELASTALLVRDSVVGKGGRIAMHVFDSDADRRAAWSNVPRAQILDASSGEQALAGWRALPAAHFVLVDPYDLADRFAAILPPALDAAKSACVLFYLYNKSPRSGGHERGYRALRRAFARGSPPPSRQLLGRIPADAILPRAFHEVILVGPDALVSPLEPELREVTEAMAARLAQAGAFEAS